MNLIRAGVRWNKNTLNGLLSKPCTAETQTAFCLYVSNIVIYANKKMNQEQKARHIQELEKIFDFLSVEDVKNGRYYISSEDFVTAIELIKKEVFQRIEDQFKESILNEITTQELQLDKQDAEGHIWWNKFRTFITDLVKLNCMVCGKEYIGTAPQYCCSGRECGCMGQPIDPIACSQECYDNLLKNI